MQNKTLLASAMGILAFSVSIAATAAKPEDAIKYRRGVMAAQGWNTSAMGAMVKGEKPYDKAEFAQRAANLAALAKMGIEGFSVEGADKGDSKTKPEAFAEMDKFKAGMEKLNTESAKLAQIAAAGELPTIKAQFGEVAKVCKGCHDNYRAK